VRRRDLVLAAAGAALARPAAAAAALEGDPAILGRLIAREQAAAFAHRMASTAVVEAAGFGAHEHAHARALRTHLAALGREGPEPPLSAAGLDRDARALAEAAGRAAILDAGIALEASLVAEYGAALRELAEPSIAQTAASILAGHAQHRTVLRVAAGRDRVG
jgi:hypothetical protein